MNYKILNIRIVKSQAKNPLNYPIVLLRGLGRSMSFWLNFENELLKYFDIVFVDLLGTGGSKDFFGRKSIEKFAQDVLFTLNYYNIKNFHLAGMSLGGMVVLEISHILGKNNWNQLSCKSIIVLSSSAMGSGVKRIFIAPLICIIVSLFLSFFSGNLSHKYFAKYLIANRNIPLEFWITKWDNIWKNEYFSRMALLRQLISASIYKIKLNSKQLKYNYLFLVSKDDALVPWQNTVYLWQKTPLASLVVLDGLGHDLTTDSPEIIATIFYNFSLKFDV
nr:hypothetical protein GTC16762_00290 [Pigmentibacter ruber]